MRSSKISGRVFAALGLALMFLQDAAQACPGCKQAEGQPLNGASIGFGFGVLFLLFMVAATLGGLGWMMYRACQTLAAHHGVSAGDHHGLAAGETA